MSQGIHPEGAGGPRSSTSSGTRSRPAGARSLPADDVPDASRGQRLHLGDLLRGPADAGPGDRAAQALAGPPPIGGTGIRWEPVVHDGDEIVVGRRGEPRSSTRSRSCSDGSGPIGTAGPRKIGIDDIVVVAPYNAQVAHDPGSAERRLGRPARVGTVDRFQGQEAPVAIYSMAASSAEDAPRGMAFLYDGHRLNVAVSRAMGLAIVVASPELLLVAPHGPGADAPGQRAVPARRDRRRTRPAADACRRSTRAADRGRAAAAVADAHGRTAPGDLTLGL